MAGSMASIPDCAAIISCFLSTDRRTAQDALWELPKILSLLQEGDTTCYGQVISSLRSILLKLMDLAEAKKQDPALASMASLAQVCPEDCAACLGEEGLLHFISTLSRLQEQASPSGGREDADWFTATATYLLAHLLDTSTSPVAVRVADAFAKALLLPPTGASRRAQLMSAQMLSTCTPITEPGALATVHAWLAQAPASVAGAGHAGARGSGRAGTSAGATRADGVAGQYVDGLWALPAAAAIRGAGGGGAGVCARGVRVRAAAGAAA